jgi:quercetin dioxygenase-like cupin family protein
MSGSRVVVLAFLSLPSVAAGQATTGVELENEVVRVIRPRYGPGESMPMHEHPHRVIVPLTDGRVEQSFPDGRVATGELKAGEARYAPPTRHAVRNLGGARLELVEVEIKPLARPRTLALPDRVGQDPAHFSLVFENDKVRVLRFRLGPRERGQRHVDAPHVTVFLSAAHLRLVGPDGRAEEARVEAGAAAWTGPAEHAPENLGDQPVELLSIEPKASPSG